jgi:hypothetical protein
MSASLKLPANLARQLHALRSFMARKLPESHAGNPRTSLSDRLLDVFLRTWDLGFTAFGGPPVHFQILHQRFVEGKSGKERWVDEQTVGHCIPYAFRQSSVDLKIVPRAICDMSRSPRTRKHQDGVLSYASTCRLYPSCFCVLDMEVRNRPH